LKCRFQHRLLRRRQRHQRQADAAADTKSLVFSGNSRLFNARACSRSPASAALQKSAKSRGATLAVTEITPWPPSSISSSALSSQPL
jgi:hypothetical protein